MELLIIDPTESSSTRTMQSIDATGVWPWMTGSFHTSRDRIVQGVLSNRQIQTSGSTNNWLEFSAGLGPQVGGKAVWGVAASFEFDGSGTRRVMLIPHGVSSFDDLTITPGGDLSFRGHSANINLPSNTFAYFEVLIDLDAQTFSIFVNNNLVLSGTQDYDSVRNLIHFRQLGTSGTNYAYFDDFYHLGGTTGPFTDRLGPVRAVRAPLIDTAEANFIPAGAADNLAAVNKTSLATGSYNRSPAGNDEADRFRIDTSVIPEGKDILAVSHQIYYRKSDIGPRNLDAVVTGPSGANKVSQSLPERLVTFGGHDPMILTEAPGGGVLDIEALEDMEFGYEVKA